MWSPFPVLVSSKTRHVNAGPPICNNCNASGTALSQLAPTCGTDHGLRLSPNAIGARNTPHCSNPVEKRYQLARLAWGSRTTALEEYGYVKSFISDTSNATGTIDSSVQGDLLTENPCVVPVDKSLSCEFDEEAGGKGADKNTLLGAILARLEPLSFVHWPVILRTGVLEQSDTLSHLLADESPTPGAWITPLDLLLESSGYIPRSAPTIARKFGTISITKVGCASRSMRATSWICLDKMLMIPDPRNHVHDDSSYCSNPMVDLLVVVEPTSPAFRYDYPFQYLPPEPASGLDPTSLAPAQRPSITRPPVEYSRLPTTFPLAGVASLCFAARLTSPKFRNMLSLGFTFVRGSSIVARSSGFNLTSNPSQAPDDSSPGPVEVFNIWSSLDQNLEPSHGEMWQGDASQHRAGWLNQGRPTSYSTLLSNRFDALVPSCSPPPDRSIPPNTDGLHNAGSNWVIVSGTTMRDPWPLPALARVVDDREDLPRHAALAWSTHVHQPPNISPAEGPTNLLRASRGSSQLPNTLEQPANPLSVVGPPQGLHPRYVVPGRVYQLETSGSRVTTDSNVVGQTFTTEQGQQNWQPPVYEGHLASNGLSSVHAANSAVPPHPVPANFPPESAGASETRQRPHTHTCHFCQRLFRRPYLLRDHMVSHHNQQGNAYVCDHPDCGSSYSSRSNLRRHSVQKHPELHTTHTTPNPTQISGRARLPVESTAHAITNSHSPAPVQHSRQVSVVAPVGGSTLAGEVVYVQAPASGPSNLSEAELLLAEQICAGSEPPSGPRKFARARKERSNTGHSRSLKHS